MTPKLNFPQNVSCNHQGLGTHLHIYATASGRYLILSNSEEWDWTGFLEHGLHSEKLIRYIEIRRDSFGSERVVKDMTRA